jgi:hypothetical protein
MRYVWIIRLENKGKLMNTQKGNGINQGRGAGMQPNHWLPLTEYALRSGMSISTLRRKIKSNNIEYKMEDGRYLIRLDEVEEPAVTGFASSDAPVTPPAIVERVATGAVRPPLPAVAPVQEEFEEIRAEIRRSGEEGSLKWRALEARVAGIAKKLDFFTEQMAELKMLVKIFEEKLDGRL